MATDIKKREFISSITKVVQYIPIENVNDAERYTLCFPENIMELLKNGTAKLHIDESGLLSTTVRGQNGQILCHGKLRKVNPIENNFNQLNEIMTQIFYQQALNQILSCIEQMDKKIDYINHKINEGILSEVDRQEKNFRQAVVADDPATKHDLLIATITGGNGAQANLERNIGLTFTYLEKLTNAQKDRGLNYLKNTGELFSDKNKQAIAYIDEIKVNYQAILKSSMLVAKAHYEKGNYKSIIESLENVISTVNLMEQYALLAMEWLPNSEKVFWIDEPRNRKVELARYREQLQSKRLEISISGQELKELMGEE